MLEIGQKAPEFRGDGSTIKGVVEGLKYNKIFLGGGFTDGYVSLSVANNYERIIIPIYKKWRVIAVGGFWIQASTANEDPVLDFGYNSNDDAFAKMTSVITGGEKFCVGDFQKYDPLHLLTAEIITETSATMDITWTEGTEFNVWQNTVLDIWCREAAAGAMSSGYVMPYMIIEVDTGGKW